MTETPAETNSEEQSAEAARQAMKSKSFHSYPFYSPRFWHGMTFSNWIRLMMKNRFHVHPTRIPMTAALCVVTPINSVLKRLQNLCYGRAIEQTEISKPPVFIIGHWRSGTTLLHELLASDHRYAYPTTFQCFCPHHFLLTEWLMTRFFGFLLPSKRPMDNMSFGWSKPQEDEFALLTLGAPSPYRRMAFPNREWSDMEFFDMVDITPEQRQQWRQRMEHFIRVLTYKDNKPIMLKSPPHTGRVSELANLFPGAKFIHIARDPYSLFASTRRLWYALDHAQGFQHGHHRRTDEYILVCLEKMYASFFKGCEELEPNQIAYTRYEDLIASPIEQISNIYETLELDAFETVRPGIEKQMAQRADYRPHRHQFESGLNDEINRRWQSYFEAFGYEQLDGTSS